MTTIAEEMKREADALTRRFIAYCAPRRPLTLDEARALAKRMDDVGAKCQN